MKKIILGLIIGLAALLALIYLGRNMIIKTGIEQGVKHAMGLDLNVGHLDVNMAGTLIDIRDIVLYQPDGFDQGEMVNVGEVYVDYELQPFFQGRVHLTEARLELKELVIVKNKDGQLNYEALKPQTTEKPAAEDKPQTQDEGEAPEVRIDRLTLKVGKVYFKDYTKGEDPEVQEYNIDISETLTDVSGAQDVVGVITQRAFVLLNQILLKTAVANIGDLGGVMQDSLSNLGGSLKDLGSGVGSSLGEGAEGLKGGVEGVEDSLKEGLDKIKLPFGGE